MGSRIYIVVAMMMVVCGGLLILCGVSETAYAVECDPQAAIDELACDHAEAKTPHHQPGVNISCTYGPSGCTVASGSRCEDMDGYQVAASGVCVSAFPPPYTSCVADYGPTFVPLKYITARCEVGTSGCSCGVYYDNSYDIQYSEVCDCLDT